MVAMEVAIIFFAVVFLSTGDWPYDLVKNKLSRMDKAIPDFIFILKLSE
jgi:hypothetical protein